MMSNPFLNKTDLMDRDIETAVLLEQAIVTNINNAVAYTDGEKVFVNTDDNLNNILPAYNQRMLKWILWHEKYHLELRHHNRYFKYLTELDEKDTTKQFNLTKDEINIIMDILVHDSLIKLFPELVETAVNNYAQIRNRNSLKYTFKTFTLEEMLDEFSKYKKDDTTDATEDKTDTEEEDKTDTEEEDKTDTEEDKTDTEEDKTDTEEDKKPLPDEHDKTDWTQLENISTEEFITTEKSRNIQNEIIELKRKKFKLINLTKTLNGLVTSKRTRTYSQPNPIKLQKNVILKGSRPGRSLLYLIFDASGSMTYEMDTFKEIISKSIPQAMETPCEWFSGGRHPIAPYKPDYYKGQFKDFMQVYATGGYGDDGDRTIELCWQAEQQGYSPIGITDGGGQISWSKNKLKQLKRTVLVGQDPCWLNEVKEINPTIQILDI